MRKKLLLAISSILCNCVFGQVNGSIYKFQFENEKLYLCYRGTEAKRNLVAGDFNLTKYPATHIGLGLKIDNKDIIFNVSSDQVINNTALILDSFKSFFPLNTDLYFISVYSKEITTKQKKRLTQILKRLQEKQIVFDRRFELTNKDTLYCSEFVVNVLESLYQVKYSPQKINLTSNLYKTYFKNNFLLYYPVDYFIARKSFQKCTEIFLNKNSTK